jgi:hypothetical protein
MIRLIHQYPRYVQQMPELKYATNEKYSFLLSFAFIREMQIVIRTNERLVTATLV